MQIRFFKSCTEFVGKYLCWSLFLMKFQVLRPAALLKAAPVNVFSYKICKVFKNTYFVEYLQTYIYIYIYIGSLFRGEEKYEYYLRII